MKTNCRHSGYGVAKSSFASIKLLYAIALIAAPLLPAGPTAKVQAQGVTCPHKGIASIIF
jgi:hypothetical protein